MKLKLPIGKIKLEDIIKKHSSNNFNSKGYSLIKAEDLFEINEPDTTIENYITDKEDFEKSNESECFIVYRLHEDKANNFNDYYLFKDKKPIAMIFTEVFESSKSILIKRIQGITYKKRKDKPNFFNFNYREFLIESIEEIAKYNSLEHIGIISADNNPYIDNSFSYDRAKKNYDEIALNMNYKPEYSKFYSFKDFLNLKKN